MSLGQFGFLPWMQKGLINKSSQIDDPDLTLPVHLGRIPLPVTLTTADGSVITQALNLIGPGDVIAVDSNIIVRTEPGDGVYTYDDNYMPFIEFADVDFLWRYTPGNAQSDQQLRSWLALIVLEDSEFTILPPAGDGLPQILQLNVPFSDVLHPHTDHWAWAHVNVNAIPASSPPLTTDFENELASNPAAGISRLLCSRKLSTQTNYTAFLIPAFETGRLSGNGLPFSTINTQQHSWNLANTIGGGNNLFPIYYSWRFGTSALGDFETLARALVPRALDPSLGDAPMDISNSGMGLDSLFYGTSPAETTTTVNMEGALMPPSYVSEETQTLSYMADPTNPYQAYTEQLFDILSIASAVQDPSYTGSTTNPFIPSESFATDDPVILPPLYGQWHANVSSLSPPAPASPPQTWIQELNLDVRYRAAAGLGSQVVRANKQAFISAAWDQVGEVLQVNGKIVTAVLAELASYNIFKKHFVGDLGIISGAALVSDNQKMNTTAKIGSLFFPKIKFSTSTAASGSILPSYNIKKASQFAVITPAAVNSGFRKIVRNRSNFIKTLGLDTTTREELIGNMNAGTVKAASASVILPKIVASVAILGATAHANATSITAAAGSSGAAGAMEVIISSVYLQSFQSLLTTLNTYELVETGLTPPSETLDAAEFVNSVQGAVDPSVTVPARVTAQINLEYQGILSSGPFNEIMAYPIIDDSTYEYLINISSDYLLPNLSQYPNNTVTLLQSNNRFIHAFLAGMNHEFSRELLWQGYPTDQRGSYFRRFWDVSDTINSDIASNSFLYDIDMMHTWQLPLGQNDLSTRHAGLNPSFVTLLVRGDLLKKFPNALIYAQKADWNPSPPANSHILDTSDLMSGGLPNPAKLQFPMFQARLQPDVVLLAFNLTAAEVLGNPSSASPPIASPPIDAGWFFVFRERPGQLRFGMADPPGPATMSSWDDINWGYMADGSGNIATAFLNPLHSAFNPITMYNSTIPTSSPHWDGGSNSANIAYILFQDPVMVAIHGESMLYQP